MIESLLTIQANDAQRTIIVRHLKILTRRHRATLITTISSRIFTRINNSSSNNNNTQTIKRLDLCIRLR